MAVREDVVASAVNFLQDPNVGSSSLESRISFLRSKNLTQEEIDVSLARAGSPPASSSQAVTAPVYHQPPPQYYGQQPPVPYGWQPPPPPPPKRDWRDWFIMATVVGGVSYGLFSISKRYIAPLVAPPTPEKLEQDKATVDEQFDKAFATLEQLAKDTDALKASEQDRTEKLDKILTELETFMVDTKSASRRQEDETDRLRGEMKSLKEVIPKSMTAQKDFTDGRLREIANEVKSLKSLIGKRMSTPAAPANNNNNNNNHSNNALAGSGSNQFRAIGSNAAPVSPAPAAVAPAPEPEAKENGDASAAAAAPEAPAQASKQDYLSSLGGRSSPFGTGMPAGKAAIPAWQMAMANKSSGGDSASGSQQEAGGSA